MSNTQRKDTCEHRIDTQLADRIEDLRKAWDAYCNGTEADGEALHEYGLSFDYVAPQTFDDQPEGYFRYQLSWGGPSDEFRFFVNPDLSLHRVEYWFLDWFDGAHRVLAQDDRAFLFELWSWFAEGGAPQAALREAYR
ncbi:MAG: hypothetical protein IT539_01460 [Bradyrhizobiaceae bacterium]|nr:hypothetical protein [Bradyrhizobiaceae bacterium]